MNATDQELLECFQGTGEQRPFEELVRRHLGLVRATATRVAGQQMLADETAQIVFTKLAKLPTLKPGVSLIAWLHRTTRSTALDLVRTEVRRGKREQVAVSMSMNESYVPWERLSPVLDDVINGLSADERHMVLCRYFEGQSHAEIARSLNVSEDALRMRVNRALEKVRVLLQGRGITTTASALALVLPAHALVAPVSAVQVTSVTAAALSSLPPSLGLIKIIAITMTKKSASIVGTLLILACGGATLYFTSQNHDSAATESAGTDTEIRANGANPSNQTAANSAPAISTAASQRSKETSAEETALIEKYGKSRVANSKRVTRLMLKMLGKDGIASIMETMGKQSKPEDMAYFTESFELTDEEKKSVEALYDKMQSQKQQRYAADIAFLAENPDALAERLLAGDALKRGEISEAEFRDVVRKLDRRVWKPGLLLNSRAGNLDAYQLMGEDEFVAGLKGALDSDWAALVDEIVATYPEIKEAKQQRIAAETELPTAGDAETLEEIDKMTASVLKALGSAKIFLEDADSVIRKGDNDGEK